MDAPGFPPRISPWMPPDFPPTFFEIRECYGCPRDFLDKSPPERARPKHGRLDHMDSHDHLPAGRVCTIVGAGPGVSLGVARAFAAEGFTICLIARSLDKLNSVAAKLRDEGVQALPFAADAGDERSLRAAFEQIRSAAGETEVLVYNAYAFHPGMPSTLAVDDLMADFAVSVAGALAAVKAVLPAMKAAGSGTILFTGGGLALQPSAPAASLSIGKAGLRSLAFSLFEELRPSGIHAATVTICGPVQEGTHFSPDLIAREFLALHQQKQPGWQPEILYR